MILGLRTRARKVGGAKRRPLPSPDPVPRPHPQLGKGLVTFERFLSLVPRPHPQNGKGSGDIRAFSWLCCVSSHVTTTRHAYGIRRTVPYVVSCVLLTQHNQENARMSPDPFPFCGWGLGTRLAFSWLCCVSSHVTTKRHAYGIRRTVLYVVSCVLLTQHNQENARMSPDPFPFVGGVWGRD